MQIACGLERPWLPQIVRRRAVPAKTVTWLAGKGARWSKAIEKAVRPRLAALSRRPLSIAIGIGLVVQGLGLALPLPIPGSNWIFIAPILVYALALLEEDGLFVLAAHALTAAEIALAVAFSKPLFEALERSIEWVASFF